MTEWTLKATQGSLPENAFSLGAIRKFENKRFEIADSVIIGRDEDCCDFTLPWKHISRQHTKLSVAEDGLEIRDLGSANGTYLNGKPITSAIAQPGDIIGFDKVKLIVVGPQGELEPNEPSAVEEEPLSNHTMVRPINQNLRSAQPKPSFFKSLFARKSDTTTPRRAGRRNQVQSDMDKTGFAVTVKMKSKTFYLIKGVLFGLVVATLAIFALAYFKV